MPYLALLPSLICGLALSVEDIRHREVPRAWVAAGALVQLAVLAALAFAHHDAMEVVSPLLYGLAAFGIQFAMGRLQAGSLGLGDATASFMIGQAVGSLGFEPFLVWWMAMGLLGLIWIPLWSVLLKRNTIRKIAGDEDQNDRRDRTDTKVNHNQFDPSAEPNAQVSSRDTPYDAQDARDARDARDAQDAANAQTAQAAQDARNVQNEPDRHSGLPSAKAPFVPVIVVAAIIVVLFESIAQ